MTSLNLIRKTVKPVVLPLFHRIRRRGVTSLYLTQKPLIPF